MRFWLIILAGAIVTALAWWFVVVPIGQTIAEALECKC
jgi:hypothetical protein